MDEFFDDVLASLVTIHRTDRCKLFASLLHGLSVAARGSYVAAGNSTEDAWRELEAFNEVLHAVANKIRDDLDDGDYADRDWIRGLRDRAHYAGSDVEGGLAWAFDHALGGLVPGWTKSHDTQVL